MCAESATITTKQAVEAYNFLADEWLVDAATNADGKPFAIAAALTIIQRIVLEQRPAFFIVAGQRGGGKTTLASMITTAALGNIHIHSPERLKSSPVAQLPNSRAENGAWTDISTLGSGQLGQLGELLGRFGSEKQKFPRNRPGESDPKEAIDVLRRLKDVA